MDTPVVTQLKFVYVVVQIAIFPNRSLISSAKGTTIYTQLTLVALQVEMTADVFADCLIYQSSWVNPV